jgi:hypothetical protein
MKCTLCNERNGNTRCEGCNTLFCLSCMTKHHDELVQQFQLLMDVRNEVRQTLHVTESTSSNGKEIHCLTEIDKWEREIIQRIQQIAAKARTNINEIMMKHMNEISHRFEQLSLNMQQRQKEGDYLENDIEKIKNELDGLKNDIEQVNAKIRVDSTMSNNIKWNTLIYIGEQELPSKNDVKEESMMIASLSKFTEEQKVSDSSSLTHQTQQATASKYMFYTTHIFIFHTIDTSESNVIPIHIIKSSSSSDNPNLISSHQRTNQPGTCVLCHRLFYGAPFMSICFECDQQVRINTSRLSTRIQPQTQNTYLPAYDYRHVPVSSPPPRTIAHRLIKCPHCKHSNILNDASGNSLHYCAVCHNLIPSIW